MKTVVLSFVLLMSLLAGPAYAANAKTMLCQSSDHAVGSWFNQSKIKSSDIHVTREASCVFNCKAVSYTVFIVYEHGARLAFVVPASQWPVQVGWKTSSRVYWKYVDDSCDGGACDPVSYEQSAPVDCVAR